jgi:hypothetical protein
MAEPVKEMETAFDRSPNSQRLELERSLCQFMNVKELQKELTKLGIDTSSFIDKNDLLNALVEARINGVSPGSSTSHVTSKEVKSSSTSVSSSSADQVREARFAEERVKCQSMKVPELRRELEVLGIDAKTFFEKSEMVKALAEARVDGQKKASPSSEAQGWTSQSFSSQRPSPTREAPSQKKAGTTNFDVVLFRDPNMLPTFKRIVRGFREKTWSRWSQAVSTEWRLQREEMDGSAGFIEQGNGFVDKKSDRLGEDEVLPVVAINERKAACAAAFYTDAEMNDSNSFSLVKLIGNAGEECKGGGSAILCYLIRNSRNKEGEFSPLKVNPIPNDPQSAHYFHSFGCTEPNPLLRGLDAVFSSGMNNFYRPLFCSEPNPPKCKGYPDVAFDGGTYFSSVQGPR